MESLATYLEERNIGNKTKERELRKHINDDTLGSETWQEIVDVFSLVTDPVNDLQQVVVGGDCPVDHAQMTTTPTVAGED